MSRQGPHSLTLLVVEDEPLIRIELADHLSDMGYRVLEAASADAAIGLSKLTPRLSRSSLT